MSSHRALGLALLLVACSGSVSTGSGGSGGGGASGGAGGGGGAGPTPEEACAAVAPAVCQKLSDCTNGVLVAFRYGDLATCVARTELGCLAGYGAPDTAADPAETITCAAEIGSLVCSDIFDEALVGACAPHAGPRAIGEPCIGAAQCASAYCAVPTGAPCGTCAAPPDVSADCSLVDDCGYGLTCAQVSTCSTFGQDGEPCGPDAACGWGLACVGSSGLCVPAGNVVGAPCDTQSQNAPDCDRVLGLFCSPMTDTCVAAAIAQPGEPCGNVMGVPTGCAALGTCTMGTCVAHAADGAPCDDTVGSKCLPPAECVVPAGQSQPVCAIADGGACG